MNFQDELKEYNIPAHIDIDLGVDIVSNGLYHFEIRVQKGQIIDYVMREYVEYRQAPKGKGDFTRHSGEGSK